MKGEFLVRGERVDLGQLMANLLTVIAESYHITPPCQSENIGAKVGSVDKELDRTPGGSVANLWLRRVNGLNASGAGDVRVQVAPV